MRTSKMHVNISHAWFYQLRTHHHHTKLGVDEGEQDLPQQAVEAHVTDEPGAAEPEEHANRGDERLANTLTALPFTSDLGLAAPACVRYI